jgi:L-ascorbate metabolism protein UlaG (beta-lactamase superfamily)
MWHTGAYVSKPMPTSLATWKRVRDRAADKRHLLRVADFLGRGRGRMRFLDHVGNVPAAPLKPDLSRWHDQALAAAWLGHATVLLRIGGMTILTDPVLSPRVGVGLGLITGGPRRLVAPALSLRQLPPIDLVLISHAHFDHLDRPTLTRLGKRAHVVTAHHTTDLLRDLNFARLTELRWGESVTVGPLTVTAQKVRHWGARTLYDRHRGYNAYLIESAGHRVLFGGDTAYCDDFRDIQPPVDLAILGIGGYDPYAFAHANPEQAWEMALHCGAERILPIHHGTFRLSQEPPDEPMERMLEVAGKDADRVIVRAVGGSWSL